MPLIVSDPRGDAHGSRRTPCRGAAHLERRRRAAAADDRAAARTTGARPALRADRRRAPTSPAILADPRAPGRHYVLHATDEVVTEFAPQPYAADAPLHVTAHAHAERQVRDLLATGAPDAIEPLAAGAGARALRLHDPRRAASSSTTAPGTAALEAPLQATLEQALREELHAPLPRHAGRRARARPRDYFRRPRKPLAATAAARLRRDRPPKRGR